MRQPSNDMRQPAEHTVLESTSPALRDGPAMPRSSIPVRVLSLVCFVGLAGGISPASARAQGIVMQPPLSTTVELAPFIGYRVGGNIWYDTYGSYPGESYVDQYDLDPSVSYGLLVDVALSDSLKIEGLISHQETHLDTPGFFGPQGPLMTVDHYQAGLAREFGSDRLRPFLSGLLGVTRYHPKVEGADSEIEFGFSMGGGLKAFLSDNYGVRLDARAHSSFGNGGAGVACGMGGCGFSFGSWGSWQGEFSAAFIFAF